jgi:hypothetical protein
MKKILLLFIVTITYTISAQESVLLRYNFKKGDVYKIKIMMSQEMGTVMSQKVGSILIQKTIDVKEDTIVNQTKIDKMVMDMTQGGQTMSYDSSMKEEELDEKGKLMKTQMAPILSALVTTKTNNLGDVFNTAVEPNIPQVAQMSNQNSSVVYPKEAVKVKSVWNSTIEKNGVIMKMNYTVTSISTKEVTVKIGGDISGLSSGTISGKMIIDRSSGVSKQSNLQMKMNIQGQEMLTTVEGNIEKL